MTDSVQVAVRMRPFNSREKERDAKCCIRMVRETNQTIIVHPESGAEKLFTFDFSYDSFNPEDSHYCSQETVWADIGVKVLQNAYEGYNVSLFAYGQTGAGKSYSMMGYPPTPINPGSGIIPIACDKIFDRIRSNDDPNLTIKVETSMLEIYMEKVRDLFEPQAGQKKVRNNPKTGPYVEDLSRNAVNCFDDVEQLMELGSKARTVAATNMNATSSRAHTIFQLVLTQTMVNRDTMQATDKVSVINLIDLAGSERQSGTGASGDRLKEGSAINQSLSALGNVISALAHNASNKKQMLVPYRNSVLTQLLKNSLGGNAKTVMIAAISPADINYDETLSTLRYADRAKQIKNSAVVNEDPNEKLIRSLRAEIDALRKALEGGGVVLGAAGGGAMSAEDAEELRRKFEAEKEEEMRKFREQLEALENEKKKSWEEKLKESQARALLLMGGPALSKEEEEAKRLSTPHLTNLHEDPMFSHQITHFFEPGETRVGRKGADPAPDIILGGLSIRQQHCVFTAAEGGGVTVRVSDKAKVHVNGSAVSPGVDTELHPHDRIIVGNHHVFLFMNPLQLAPEGDAGEDPLQKYDWEFAIKEVNAAAVNALTEEDAEGGAAGADPEVEAKLRAMEEAMAAERARAAEEAAALRKRMEEEMQRQMREREEALRAGMPDDSELQRRLKEQEERLAREQQQQLEEQQQRMAELETRLKHQVEETERLAARKKREQQERSMMDELLLKTIPLVNEANAMAEEMARPLRCSIKLMARTHMTGTEAGYTETNLLIKVVWGGAAQGEVETLWTHDKFMDRLYLMRELYQRFEEEGIAAVEPGSDDPFVDQSEEVLIGKALVYLDHLYYLMDIEERLPIMDYRGMVKGEVLLDISLRVMDAQDKLLDPEELEEEQLTAYVGRKLRVRFAIPAAKGLPNKLAEGAFARFKWFLDDAYTETPRATGRSINPEFAFVKETEQVATQQFCDFLAKDALEVEVWGNRSGVELAAPVRAESAASTGGDAEEKEGEGREEAELIEELREQLARERASREEQERAMQRELERLKHAAPPASPRRAAAGAEETKEQALPAIPSDEERARLRRELEEAKQEKARVEQEQQQAMEEIERLKKALANQQKSSTCTLQ